MRIAAIADVDQVPRPETVLTAHASGEQLRDLLPAMQQPGDLSSPGPVRVAHITSSTGHRTVLVFHERKSLIEILATLEPGLEQGLANMLAELHVPVAAITWTHDRIDRDALVARYEHSLIPS